jgi:hypothetical protein
MNRRTVLKRIAISSAVAFLFPACIKDKDKETYVELHNLKITNDEKDLIGDIADITIPETDTPGARKLEAHVFTLVMVDDCMSREDQDKYIKGMRAFDETVKSKTGKSFRDASADERAAMLAHLQDGKETLPDEVSYFYNKTRGYIVQAYLTSQHFLTNVKKYELVPGPDFKGCVPVADLQQPSV